MPCPFGFTKAEGEEDEDEIEELDEKPVDENEPILEDADDEESGSVLEDMEDVSDPKNDASAAAEQPAKVKTEPKTKSSGGFLKGFLKSETPPSKASAGACPFGHAATSKQGGCPMGQGLDDDPRFDYDKDPVSWFYQHQIRSEEEFQKKKSQLREAAKKRLDDIMARKNKAIELDSDDDFNWSVASSELSDLDSDVDSISSMISCADSWIAEAHYPERASYMLSYAAVPALAVVTHVLWTSFAVARSGATFGAPNLSLWALGIFGLGLLSVYGVACLYYASSRRTRKILLRGQVLLVLIYGAAVFVGVALYYHPRGVDGKMKDTACGRYSNTEHGARLCSMIPSMEEDINNRIMSLVWASGLIAGVSLLLLVLGTWCLFELCYIEKKAFKHKRRHKRRKKTIPWDKIKIVGPVTSCG